MEKVYIWPPDDRSATEAWTHRIYRFVQYCGFVELVKNPKEADRIVCFCMENYDDIKEEYGNGNLTNLLLVTSDLRAAGAILEWSMGSTYYLMSHEKTKEVLNVLKEALELVQHKGKIAGLINGAMVDIAASHTSLY